MLFASDRRTRDSAYTCKPVCFAKAGTRLSIPTSRQTIAGSSRLVNVVLGYQDCSVRYRFRGLQGGLVEKD